MAITLTAERSANYQRLFDTLEIRAERGKAVEAIADQALQLQPRYEAIGAPLAIPWFFIAAVHLRESAFRLDGHLHNGDPLSARTLHVPAGRPASGEPPFTFEDSASDALTLKKLNTWTDWSVPGLLFKLEAYNGFGYASRGLPSPYLWSFSNHYVRGKFVRDGQFDEATVDAQCGAATLLRRLAERQDIRFDDQPATDVPLLVGFVATRPRARAVIEQAVALQHWLNTFPGVYVKTDGWPGRRTSDAFLRVSGCYLPGDPRRHPDA